MSRSWSTTAPSKPRYITRHYVAVGITGIATFGIFLFLTYYMQQVKGYSPLTTGLLFLPLVAGILAASTMYSALPRVGPRPLITVGMLLGAGGTFYLAQLTVTSTYLGGVLPALLIMGLGFGAILAMVTLPSWKQLEELTGEASAPRVPVPEPAVAALALPPQHDVAAVPHPAVKVMPVGLLCCSPVIDAGLLPATARPSS